MRTSISLRSRPGKLSLGVLAAVIVASSGLLLASRTGTEAADGNGLGPQVAAQQPPAAAAESPVVSGLLKVEPVSGYIGQSFDIHGDKFAPGAEVSFDWVTSDGRYETKVHEKGASFVGPRFDDKRVLLGTAVADSEGHVKASFTAPADFGGAHDIYASVGGEDIARGGFQITRRITVTPEAGPVGTPITIRVEGLERWMYGRALSVVYNGAYIGYLSGITNSGVATATIRAAGPPGLHTVDLIPFGAAGVPFLTLHQSPFAHMYPDTGAFRFKFRVTDDPGASEPILEWPAAELVAQLKEGDPFPTASGVGIPKGVTFQMEPQRGTVESPVDVRLTGLRPGANVALEWATVGGAGGGASPMVAEAIPLGDHQVAADGSLSAKFEVPNQLGGWHAVQLMVDGKVYAERGFYVERRLISAPKQVRVGEAFSIKLDGSGYQDLDNGWGVVYNNTFMGYACGFTARGPVTLHFVASGSPGTHLIDLYPLVFRGINGTGEEPWPYQHPHLNALEDHPGLGLGMRLPIVRISIDVVE
jgi:hypothetical protein